MVSKDKQDALVQVLAGAKAMDWTEIGRVLLELEAQSRTDGSGRPWQDVIKERLKQVGVPVSAGHIYKIRRAYSFLQDQGKLPFAPERSIPPKISSIEVVERLFRIDPEAGKTALEDALAPIPAPYVELKKRYDAALEANPEMKSPRQVAWEIRRQTAKPQEVQPRELDAPVRGTDAVTNKSARQHQIIGPSADLRRDHDELLARAWNEGWEMALERSDQEVKKLHSVIARQTRELEGHRKESRQKLQLLEMHNETPSGRLHPDKVREVAGLVQGSDDLYIYTPDEMYKIVADLLNKAFPKADTTLPMKPHLVRGRSKFETTPRRFNEGDVAVVLALLSLPAGFDFKEEIRQAHYYKVPVILLQAVAFELPQDAWEGCHVCSLELQPDIHPTLASIYLTATLAEIRQVADGGDHFLTSR